MLQLLWQNNRDIVYEAGGCDEDDDDTGGYVAFYLLSGNRKASPRVYVNGVVVDSLKKKSEKNSELEK